MGALRGGIGEGRTGRGRRQPRAVEVVLDRERQAVERPSLGPARFECQGLAEDILLAPEGDPDGVRAVLGDAPVDDTHELRGGRSAGRVQRGKSRPIEAEARCSPARRVISPGLPARRARAPSSRRSRPGRGSWRAPPTSAPGSSSPSRPRPAGTRNPGRWPRASWSGRTPRS